MTRQHQDDSIFLDRLFEGDDERDRAIFEPIKQFHKPPKRFIHTGWQLVAELPKDPQDGDGQIARIYEERMPARFFKVEAVAGSNSVGEAKPGFALSTGSGDEMGALCVRIAQAIALGMLGLNDE